MESLKHLELDVASSAYQKLGHVSMAFYINWISTRQVKLTELKAEVAVILCDYEVAKELYLLNKQTNKAIELLMNIHEYKEAQDVAKKNSLIIEEL